MGLPEPSSAFVSPYASPLGPSGAVRFDPDPASVGVEEYGRGSAAASIADLRARLKAEIANEASFAAMRDSLLDGLQASRDVWFTCPHCKKRSPVSLPDLGQRASAAAKILDAIEPRLGTADPEPDVEGLVGRPAEELSAAERRLLLAKVREKLNEGED